ncbi:hypothetical protein BH18THE2_BH18THE2_19340 [soil metagenome]
MVIDAIAALHLLRMKKLLTYKHLDESISIKFGRDSHVHQVSNQIALN